MITVLSRKWSTSILISIACFGIISLLILKDLHDVTNRLDLVIAKQSVQQELLVPPRTAANTIDLQLLQHASTAPVQVGCKSTDPGRIRTWRENGLVTHLASSLEVSCTDLQAGNSTALKNVRADLDNWTNAESEHDLYRKLAKCSYVNDVFHPTNFYTSETEVNFPLAYAVLFYDSPQQIVRLLKVIYRPHNIYCLHPDGKTNKRLIQAFRHLASCLDNVFVPRQLVKVTYMHFSMVEAQLTCMQELSTTYKHWQWKYAMILCGKELPFSTNRVIVEGLQRLNGHSLLSPHSLSLKEYKDRFTAHFRRNLYDGKMHKVGLRRKPLPVGIQIYKSSNYIAASREFVKFLINDKRVQIISRFMFTAKAPDEEFFATTYMLPGAPRGGKRKKGRWMTMNKQYFSTYSNPYACSGKKVHYSCILNSRDLQKLFAYGKTRDVFFFNKYFMDYDHVVMDCMERRIVQQNQLEYQRDCL